MKHMGYNERLGEDKRSDIDDVTDLVNIVACVTLTEPIMLIMEDCHHKDLLEFMRRRYYRSSNKKKYFQ